MARVLPCLTGDGMLEHARLLQPGTMARGFQSRLRLGTVVYGHSWGLNEFLSNLVFIPEIGTGVFISQNGGSRALPTASGRWRPPGRR
jgi:hypothetical protein